MTGDWYGMSYINNYLATDIFIRLVLRVSELDETVLRKM